MRNEEYKVIFRRGIDDLKPEYAFVGSSQGDHSATNEIEDYKNSQGWLSFIFDNVDEEDQLAIYTESAIRKQENKDYIQKLKEEGRYKEEYEIKFEFKHCPEFDDVKENTELPLSSFKGLIINLSDNE